MRQKRPGHHYGLILANPRARRALAAGIALRLPGAALFPTLTLLCVNGLHTSYAAAGVASAAYTVTGALIAPIQGRNVDRRGLRTTGLILFPLNALAWLLISRVPYGGVLALACLASATALPFWGVARQLVLRSVPDEQRTAALSLDAVGTELAYIVGPALGISLATIWRPSLAVTATGLATSLGIAVLALTNPLRTPPKTQPTATPESHSRTVRSPIHSRGIKPLLALAFLVATTLVGTDLLLLAKLRETNHASSYAAIAAIWAAGSMTGGLVYGSLNRRFRASTLTLLLAASTAPIALAQTPLLLAVTGFIAGLGCAPVMTAITDEITRLSPAHQHTEALAWYSSAHTGGATIGSTAVGALIDHRGAATATLITTAAVAAVTATIHLFALRRKQHGTTAP